MATYTLTLKYGTANSTIVTNCGVSGVWQNSAGTYWYKITSNTVYRSSTSATSGFSQITSAKTATSGSSGTSKTVYWDLVNVATPGLTRTGYHVTGTSAWKTPGGLALNQDAASATATNAPTVYRLLENKYISANKTVTIQPNWVANTYTINYSANGGSFSGTAPTTSATYNSSVTFSSTAPTRTGYVCTGWSTSPTATVHTWSLGETSTEYPNLTSENNGTATVYAVWQPKSYQVGFNDNQADEESTGLTIRIMTYGSTTNNSVTTPTRVGYTFNGYYTALSGGTQVYNSSGNAIAGTYWGSGTTTVFYVADEGPYDPNSMGTDGTYLYLYDSPNYYRITVDGSDDYVNLGTTAPSGVSNWVSSGASNLVAYQGNNYYWTHNYYDNTGRDVVNVRRVDAGGWQYTDSISLYAQWTANSYTYTLNPNGGTYNNTTGTTSKSVTSGLTTNNSPGVPTRTGYTFDGWFNNNDLQIFDNSGNPKPGVTSNSCWSSLSPSTSLGSGARYLRYGRYIFGFYIDSNGGKVVYWNGSSASWATLAGPISSITSVNSFCGVGNLVVGNVTSIQNVTTVAIGGCCNLDRDTSFGTAQLGNSALIPDMNVVGSTTLPNEGIIWIGNTNPTFYAHWTEHTATLTYNNGGHGTAPSAVTMTYTTATTAASALSASGYTFVGWKRSDNNTIIQPGATVKAANVDPTALTLTAQWTTNMTVTPTAYSGNYDGAAHSASIKVNVAGTTVEYDTSNLYAYSLIATNADTNYTMSGITRTDVGNSSGLSGTTSIGYRVTKTGYTTVTGATSITISRVSVGAKPTTAVSKTYTGSSQSNGYTTPTGVTKSGNDSGTAVGTYTATYTPDGNHKWSDNTYAAIPVTLTIGQRIVTWSAPTANSSTLTYDGTSKTLASVGSATTGGTMYYYVSDSSTAPTFNTSTWKTTIDTQINAKTWYIYYRCYVSDTTNNTGTNINTTYSISKVINKATNPMTWSSATYTSKWYGSAFSTTITAVSNAQGNVTYSLVSQVDSSDAAVTYFSFNTSTRVLSAAASVASIEVYRITLRATAAGNDNYNSKALDYVVQVSVLRSNIGNKPTTSVSKLYNMAEQTNDYTTPSNVTMTGSNKGTTVGTYTATYTPNYGYRWSDDTYDAVTVTLTIWAPCVYVKQSNAWKQSIPIIKVSGDWKVPNAVYVNVNGVWKQIT